MSDEAELSALSSRRRPKPDILTIGNRRLAPETLMMGHGFDPALSEGSLKPPIFLTSTFVFENAAAGKRFFEGVTGKRPGGVRHGKRSGVGRYAHGAAPGSVAAARLEGFSGHGQRAPA